MPAAFSRTVRTIMSIPSCSMEYSGTPRFETRKTTTAINGITPIIISESAGSIMNVTTIPPKSRIGARTPSLCIMPTIWWMLYVSVERRDIKDGSVNRSTCRHDRYDMRANRSWRTRLVQSRATADAVRLARIFPHTAMTEHTSIITPQNIISCKFLVGTIVSIMYASIHGMKRSMIVPIHFITNPTAIFRAIGRRYENISFIVSPPDMLLSVRLFFPSSPQAASFPLR